MTSNIEEFIRNPSEDLLSECSKDQLLALASHYHVGLSVADKRLKESLKSILISALVDQKVLKSEPTTSISQGSRMSLTFEQQKELLLLEMKSKEKIEEKKIEAKYDIENKRLDLERYKLDLINEGKISKEAKRLSIEGSEHECIDFDVATNLRLVPKFDEREIETFFSLFERLANATGWLDSARNLLLQCVLMGRAQEVFSSLNDQHSGNYECVKATILKAYELVPEAYRQRLRGWQKTERQTCVEFVREIQTHFNRWCSASDIKTFDELKELIVLEQFKNSIPARTATFVAEGTSRTAYAILADEYALIHKNQFGQRIVREVGRENDWVVSDKNMDSSSFSRGKNLLQGGKSELTDVCHYCQGKGHWKNNCPMLKAKAHYLGGNERTKSSAFGAKPVGLITSVQSSGERTVEDDGKTVDSSFFPFVIEGYVSLRDSKERRLVKIL
ncbi:uncharacterized protein LOC130556536 [Triplophysa rosa]|uniref:uncharacterized protein LOC130556536 n=1 Tax=Triplophysa rosa TaxID=992332 RepID=UPI0025462D5B|nr:uncharacterized protein LOC130556536 [Triplophysa rosa]